MMRLASLLRDKRLRGIALQVAAAGVVGGLVWYLTLNAAENLREQGIGFGLSFLGREAGFAIGESWIAYSARSSYARALLVGLLNTLYVSFVAILLTTVFGTLIGIARTSRYWLVAKTSFLYVELFRNIPVLLQVFFWSALFRRLPPPRQALSVGDGIFLSNRGLVHPEPLWDPAYRWVVLALFAGAVLAWLAMRWRRKTMERTGSAPRRAWLVLLMALILPLAVWMGEGAPLGWEVPHLKGFNFTGGTTHSPEFMAIVAALVAYTSAFAAEIVRAGIESVGRGQIDAAKALGLKDSVILFRIVLPQALRVILPPMTTQYLNLLKDSALGVAIGYPELVNITGTSINQTGQAIELILVMMSVYVFFSLLISTGVNLFNRANLRKGLQRT